MNDDPLPPKPPNPLLKKVRKVTGNVSELATMGSGGAPGSKPTDFRWSMDRDLDRLVLLIERNWDDATKRPQLMSELKDIIWNLKRRADRSGYKLLSAICLLFLDYVGGVEYGRQERKVVEQYFEAVRVISMKNLIGMGGQLGEATIGDLAKINEKAGVKPQ
jgi:hypothetical protein